MLAKILKNLGFVLFLTASQHCYAEFLMIESDSVGIKKGYVSKPIEKIYSDILKLSLDSTRDQLRKELASSSLKGDKRRVANANKLLGDFYARISLNDSSLYYYRRALEIGTAVDYKAFFPDITYSIANRYWETGNYSQALENALLLKEYYEKENTIENQAALINLLGIIYLRLQDYQSAVEYLNHAIKISERTKNYGLLGVSYTNLGNLYFKQERYIEALKNYEKGVRFEEENKEYQSAGRSYESISRIYLALDSPKKAEELLGKAIFYNQKSTDIIGFIRTYLSYGRLYNYLHNYERAIDYLRLAEEYAVRSDTKEYYMYTCEQFSIAYQNVNDCKTALRYQLKYLEFYKQIFNIQDYARIKKLENEYRIEKKNNELNKVKLEKQRTVAILLGFVVLLLVVISILFVVMYVRSNRSSKSLIAKNIEIQNQKDCLQEINEELEEAKMIAEESDQLKSQFLKNISHEIRTPLNGIIGFTELIVNENIPNPVYESYLNMIKDSSNRLILTIENLVEMAHITNKNIQLRITVFDPDDFIDEVYQLYAPRFEDCKDKITFSTIKAVSSGINIKTDKYILTKIVVQLLENSLKFTKEGDISIGYELNDQKVRFFIRDTGIGISESSQKLVFDLFRQEQESLTREYQGVGIGLTIAKKLSEFLDADLSFESKKEQGTTFYLTFYQVIS